MSGLPSNFLCERASVKIDSFEKSIMIPVVRKIEKSSVSVCGRTSGIQGVESVYEALYREDLALVYCGVNGDGWSVLASRAGCYCIWRLMWLMSRSLHLSPVESVVLWRACNRISHVGS